MNFFWENQRNQQWLVEFGFKCFRRAAASYHGFRFKVSTTAWTVKLGLWFYLCLCVDVCLNVFIKEREHLIPWVSERPWCQLQTFCLPLTGPSAFLITRLLIQWSCVSESFYLTGLSITSHVRKHRREWEDEGGGGWRGPVTASAQTEQIFIYLQQLDTRSSPDSSDQNTLHHCGAGW